MNQGDFAVQKRVKVFNFSWQGGWILFFVGLMFFSHEVAASETIGTMASTIIKSFENLTKLIMAGSYLAGLGFSIGAIMKFKQHKDNPTQIPIGTPIALIFIASALLFLPNILDITGQTMFGSGGGQTAGPQGMIFTSGQ